MDPYTLTELGIIQHLEINGNESINKRLIKHAIIYDYLLLFSYILEQVPVDYESNYILRTVAKRGSMEMLTLLIKNGVDLHYNKDRAFVLAYREFRWQESIAKFLLESGANPNAVTTYRVLEPCHRDRIEEVQFALENKLIPMRPGVLNKLLRGTTDSSNIIYYLLSLGANIEAIYDNFTKWCSLDPEIADKMIASGLDLDENMDKILHDTRRYSSRPSNVINHILQHEISEESFEKVARFVRMTMTDTRSFNKLMSSWPKLKKRCEELVD